MELLLLLTALFASLTGASGDRGVHAVPGVAVVRAAEVAQAAVAPARHMLAAASAAPRPVSVARLAVFHIAPLPAPALRLAFEQRRE